MIMQKHYMNYRQFLVCCLILIVIATILSSCGQSVSNKETDLPESGLQSGNGSEEGDDSSVFVEEEADSDELCQQGIAYEEGQGVEKDTVKAVELYRQAADLGNADAMYRLAMCYMNGKGVEPEAIIGQQWSQKAAELGNIDAMVLLGACYAGGVGVEKDESMAAEWYQKAADLGDVDAMIKLGYCYDNGSGVDRKSVV